MSRRIFAPKNHSLTIALSYISFHRAFRGDDSMAEDQPKTKSLRGFAALSPERQREIASKGGKSVPAERRSFAQNPELAASAGKKGGKAVPAEKRSFSHNHELAMSAGSKGGHASHGTIRKKPADQT
jgi:uncharacterized protein